MSVSEKYRAVIDEIVETDGKVTIETVRDRAGGGSSRDISAAINLWKDETSGEYVLTARDLALADAIADRVVAKLATSTTAAGLNAILGR